MILSTFARKVTNYSKRFPSRLRASPSKPKFLVAEVISRLGLNLSYCSFRTRDGSRLCLHNEGIPLGLYKGTYADHDSIQFCLDYLQAGDLAVDVGANIGHFSVAMARKVAERGIVISIEPNPYVFRCLIDNVTLNNLNNVMCKQVALSMQDPLCQCKFWIPGGNSGEGALGTKAKFERSGVYEVVDVLCRRGEALIAELGYAEREVALMKVDVEGTELDVLKGMGEGIKKIGCIHFEYSEANYEEMGFQGSQVLDFLRSEGFEVFEADSEAKRLNLLTRDIERADLVAVRDRNALLSRTGYLLENRRI